MDVTWQRSDIHANLVLPDTVTVSWAYFSCCCDLLSVLGTLKCRKFHPENCLASGVHFRKVYSVVISNRLTSCYNLLQIVQSKVSLGFPTTFFFFEYTHKSGTVVLTTLALRRQRQDDCLEISLNLASSSRLA